MGRLFFLFVYILILSNCSLQHSYLELDSNTITRFDKRTDGLSTYLVFEKVESLKDAKGYIYCNYKTILDGFQAIICFNENKQIFEIYQPYTYFRVCGEKTNFEIIQLPDTIFYKEYYSKMKKKCLKIGNP